LHSILLYFTLPDPVVKKAQNSIPDPQY
jgi:hypothetical protein